MKPNPIIDFTDIPNHTAQGQVNSTEQLAILCGLNRRTSRRLGKTVSIILANYAPESLIENSISFKSTPAGHAIEFSFLSNPIEIAEAGQVVTNRMGSLRRVGEKFADFELKGSPESGFEIRFSEPLPIGFEIPKARELKQWERIISTGDWGKAFTSVSKIHNRDRVRIQELRDGISIRSADLGAGKDQTDVILSLVASKADNPVLIFGEDGNAEWANRSFNDLTGIELVESEQNAAVDVLFGVENNESKRRFVDSLDKGRSFNLEYSWISNSQQQAEGDLAGSPVWIEFQVTPVRDETESIVRWIAIGANITRRRQAELAMQAAKEVAESANHAKSDFLAMMSHEIRTPMNAIIGMTELTLGTQLSIDQREYLTTANNSAQALLQILNDILDLSKVEAQRMELEQVDFNVADITRETLDTMAVLAQRKDLTLRCEFPLDIHQQLVGDPTRLRQIIVNIVGNAIKFTSFGEVAVNVELLDETNDAVTLHYSVRDTGVGISAEKTSRIFEAFFQSDASVNRNFGGTGLGLAITSELVRLMGGRIWVESKLGKGSTFHFVLTFTKSARTFVALPECNGLNELKGKRILVVDDNDSNRLAIGRWMKTWGVDCQFATTGRAGEAALSNDAANFDLAILDVVLPDVDGFEVARKVATAEGSTTTPILMFSSDDRTSTISRCRELGIGSYLIKPVSPKTMLNSIHLALDSNQNADGGSTAQRRQLLDKTNRPVNVLVVDDHVSNRKLIGEILRRRGHRWQEANNGAQAMERIQSEVFDVVLMDVQMPGMDGLEATLQIRKLSAECSTIPIVAVTAYVTEDDRQRCLDVTMDDYMAKPISVDELLEKVERWGNTTRDTMDGDDQAMDDQLLIQDAPDWATNITRTIVVAEEAVSEATSNGHHDQGVETRGSEHPFAQALARFGGDKSLLQMQVGIFLQETPELMQQIHKAIHDADGRALHHHAHRLKGLVRTYDDDLAGELAAKLETIGSNNELDEAESTFALLAAQVDGLSGRLRQLD